jgi:hypothetical protein
MTAHGGLFSGPCISQSWCFLLAVASLEGTLRPRGQEKPKGSLQWISHGHAVAAEVRRRIALHRGMSLVSV